MSPEAVVRLVTEVWKEILGLDNAALRKSFLDIGGTSMAAEKIAARLRASLGVRLTGSDILRVQTIEGLVELSLAKMAA